MNDFRIRFQPKQKQLLNLLRATGREVATVLGFGGAKGGGKSAGVQGCAVVLALELGAKYPGITVTIVRRVFDDLKKNHIDPLLRRFPQLVACYRAGDKEVVLNVGDVSAKIVFAYAETADDVKRKFLGGYESAIIFVDEAQQFTEEELQWISTAARWTSGAGVPEGLCKTCLLFNPGGPGSMYLRRIFWLQQYRGQEKAHGFHFIHVFGWDNYEWFRGQVDITEKAFYSQDSETRFQSFIRDTSEGRKYDAFPLSIRAGYLLGSFDHFEGQYFAGAWDERKNVLDRARVERIVKPWWVRWMAQDWAFFEHACHLWFVIGKLSPSEWCEHFGGQTDEAMDVVIIYRELVAQQRADADLASDIVRLTPNTAERRVIERFFLSQDAFGHKARQFGANTVGEQFARILRDAGLPRPEPADQDRVNGWRFMYNALRQGGLAGSTFGRERASQGPALFISTECPNVIESIPLAIHDDHKPEDVMRIAGALWEDCCDAVRYGLKSYLAASPVPYEVRRQEVYEEYNRPAEERTTEQMTALSLAMRRFDEDERKRYARVKRRR